jgi:hypothetical protein
MEKDGVMRGLWLAEGALPAWHSIATSITNLSNSTHFSYNKFISFSSSHSYMRIKGIARLVLERSLRNYAIASVTRDS